MPRLKSGTPATSGEPNLLMHVILVDNTHHYSLLSLQLVLQIYEFQITMSCFFFSLVGQSLSREVVSNVIPLLLQQGLPLWIQNRIDYPSFYSFQQSGLARKSVLLSRSNFRTSLAPDVAACFTGTVAGNSKYLQSKKESKTLVLVDM